MQLSASKEVGMQEESENSVDFITQKRKLFYNLGSSSCWSYLLQGSMCPVGKA